MVGSPVAAYRLTGAICPTWRSPSIRPFAKRRKLQEVENHTFVNAEGDAKGGTCLGTRDDRGDDHLFWYVQLRTVLNKNRPITQSEFDDIILPEADKNSTPYVEASGDGEGNIPGVSKPEVYLLPGQIVQSDPYTNPQTGLPEQDRW